MSACLNADKIDATLLLIAEKCRLSQLNTNEQTHFCKKSRPRPMKPDLDNYQQQRDGSCLQRHRFS